MYIVKKINWIETSSKILSIDNISVRVNLLCEATALTAQAYIELNAQQLSSYDI